MLNTAATAEPCPLPPSAALTMCQVALNRSDRQLAQHEHNRPTTAPQPRLHDVPGMLTHRLRGLLPSVPIAVTSQPLGTPRPPPPPPPWQAHRVKAALQECCWHPHAVCAFPPVVMLLCGSENARSLAKSPNLVLSLAMVCTVVRLIVSAATPRRGLRA